MLFCIVYRIHPLPCRVVLCGCLWFFKTLHFQQYIPALAFQSRDEIRLIGVIDALIFIRDDEQAEVVVIADTLTLHHIRCFQSKRNTRLPSPACPARPGSHDSLLCPMASARR